MSRRTGVLVSLLAVVVLGAVLRRWGWENWSLWLDECLEVFVAKHPFRQILVFLGAERNHPPLDYLVTHFMLRVSAEEAWLRWAPLAWGVATIPLVFLRAGGLARPAASLGSAFAFAVLPLAVNRGCELRAYSLAVFCIAVAGWARERAGQKRSSTVLELCASVAAVYSLYISFLSLGVSWALDLAEAWRLRSWSRARRTLAVALGTCAAFLPWLWWIRTNLLHPNEMPAPSLSIGVVAKVLTGLLAGFNAGTAYWPAAVVTLALALVGLAVLGPSDRRRVGLEVAGVLLLTGAFLLATNHWLELRYFFPAVLPLARLVGEGLARAARMRSWPRIPLYAGALAAFLGIHLPALAANARSARCDWRVPARFLLWERTAGRSGPVVPVDDWSYFLLSYQAMKWKSPLQVEEVAGTRKGLEDQLAAHRSGWVARMRGGERESGRWLAAEARPWSRSDVADGVELYRFENGKLIPP